MINKKVAYEELNLIPIWVNKKPKKINHSLFDIGLYFFNELNISIMVPEFDKLSSAAKDLFKNIHVYMNSISVNSKFSRNIEEVEVDLILKTNSISQTLLIGRTSSSLLNDLNVTIKLLPSLNEILMDPNKKKKLWQDVESLLRDEMKGNS